jgi:ankyrin repeat protein
VLSTGDVKQLGDEGWALCFSQLPPKAPVTKEIGGNAGPIEEGCSEVESSHKSLQMKVTKYGRTQLEKLFSVSPKQAVEQGRLDKIQSVLSLVPEGNQLKLLNKATVDAWSSLHIACYLGHSAVVRYLVSHKVSCNRETIDHWTPLQLACYLGHLQCVEWLLEAPSLQINKMTASRGTGLHLAAQNGHLEIVQKLIDAGAFIALEDNHGHIPLELASRQEILELIPVHMGALWLAKNKRVSEPPPIYANNVHMVQTMRLHDSLVHLVLQPSLGLLSRYSSEEVYRQRGMPTHIVDLLSIQDVHPVKRRLLQTKNSFNFLLECRTSQVRYYTWSEEHSQEWVQRILEAIEYCQVHKIGLAPPRQPASPTTPSFQPCRAEKRLDDSAELEEYKDEVISLSSFKILSEIGSGSFARVYKVQKLDSKEFYAMKSLNKDFLSRRKQLKYAIGEGKILKQLDHPFIVKLHYAFQSPKSLYYLLDYCPNGDLAMQLTDHAVFSESEAKFFIIELILALEYLHSLDILYRDLKPENILLDSNGHICLTDFGLAKDSKTVASASFVGSPAYLAPEMLTDKISSKASDVYTLGLVFYELLAGKSPYYDPDISKLFDNIRSAKLTFPPSMSPSAVDFITALLSQNPERRPTISDCKLHPMFLDTDWESYLQGNVTSPVKFQSRREVMDLIFIE